MTKLARFWSWLTEFLGRSAETIQKITDAALPIVELIATLTPTRSDDEIVALFEKFLLPNVQAFLALPVDQRGMALLAAATAALQRQFPNIPIHQIQAAIQLALSQLKAKGQSDAAASAAAASASGV